MDYPSLIYDSLTPEQQTQIAEYLERVLEKNKTLNLTRITEENALLLHGEDSLAALPELTAAPDGLYGDMGSGGGFPGVPLAIASQRRTVLMDSVKKKMDAVSSILNVMNLSEQITTLGDRIEDVARAHPEEFLVLTARALTRLAALLELASPLLPLGGQLICFKSSQSEEEFQEAQKVADILGMTILSQRSYALSDGQTERILYTFQKVHEPSIHLPRKNGFAQKKPLPRK